MNIPDYISPVTGWRVWQWDEAGMRSLNGEPWLPGEPLQASCRVLSREGVGLPHDAPQQKCTCGLYATKSLEHLQRTGYQQWGVTGEVWLWGRVVEHQLGWRAQFAYPKTFLLSSSELPFTLAATQKCLETLADYGADVNIISPAGNTPLWRRQTGYEQAGLDYLIDIRRAEYNRRTRRVLRRGDRVAILGRGLAVVRMVDYGLVCAVLSTQTFVEIPRRQVVWSEQNNRWEADCSNIFERTAAPHSPTTHRR